MTAGLQPAPDVHAVPRKDVRTVILSSLMGTTVEWYDFFLYSTAASLVFDKLFFPTDDPTVSTMLAFVTFFVGFVARPLGGVLFGHIGDRIGRKRTLVSTMLLMGLSTAAMGALPTYEQVGLLAPLLLVLLRVVQGLAIGGEWAGAVLMAVEYAPPGRNTLLGLLSRWAEGAAFNTWAVFFLSYATSTLHLPRNSVLVSVMLAAGVLAVLLPVFGRLSDRITPRRAYALGAGLFAASVYPAFLAFQTRDVLLCGLIIVGVLGVVHALLYAPQGTLYAQLAPVRSRYTGMSFVYQFSGIYASGLTPLIITALIAAGGGSPWLACGYLALTGLIGLTATIALRPADLESATSG